MLRFFKDNVGIKATLVAASTLTGATMFFKKDAQQTNQNQKQTELSQTTSVYTQAMAGKIR